MAIGKTNNNLIVPDSVYDKFLWITTSTDNLVTLIDDFSQEVVKESYPDSKGFFKVHNLIEGKTYTIKISKGKKVLTKNYVYTSSSKTIKFDFPH